MKLLKGKFIVSDYKRLNNSIYGNPHYALWLINENGDFIKAKTGTDKPSNFYSYSDFKNTQQQINFVYHITKNNNIIIDYVNL